MEITKDELEKLYNTMTNKDLAEKLGISMMTLNKIIKEAGIQGKGKGGGKASERKIRVVS